MRRLVLLLAVTAAAAVACRPAVAAPRRAQHNGRNQLARVLLPEAKSTVPAHPWVNVVVIMGTLPNGTAADPETFRAHLGRADITDQFTREVVDGAVRMRAQLLPPLVKTGRRANHLRLSVRSTPIAVKGRRRPRTLRDVDRIRFRAVEAPNQPPVARIAATEDLAVAGLPVAFDGRRSTDPEDDPLTYHWDFGDGTTSTEPAPAHEYADGTGERVVTLTVSDGLATATAQTALMALPGVDEGRTPGLLRVEGDQALEMGVVGIGATGTATFTVRNRDETPTSQLQVRIAVDAPGFLATPDELDLGPGQSAPVTLTFAPAAEGHAGGEVTVLASAANRPIVRLLTHGYGGAAAGTGPSLAAQPLFFLELLRNTPSILHPSGARGVVDNLIGMCEEGGFPTGDLCVTNGDCPGAGRCSSTFAGELEPIDFCGDGQGGVFIITDDGTFTHPTNEELSVTIGHVALDANGNRTGARILTRTTSQTDQLACDELPNGRVYAAEYLVKDFGLQCFRDAQESLSVWTKNAGAPVNGSPPYPKRIDAVEGASECDDDIDEAQGFEVTRDGSAVFAALEGIFNVPGGLFRIWPSPLLMTPDITDYFQLHPDGSVLYVTAPRTGTTRSPLNLYKITQAQALTGAPRLQNLPPCAVWEAPTNGGRTFLFNSYAAGRAAGAPNDAVVIASFRTQPPDGERGADGPVANPLVPQGTVAFRSPPGAVACSVAGLVTLEYLDQMSF